MSANIGTFRMEILDSNTNTVLKHTRIGDRTYVSAIEGNEFIVQVTVQDPAKYIDKLNGDDQLICDFHFNGSYGTALMLNCRTSAAGVKFNCKSVTSLQGAKALVFDAPAIIPFFDMEDAKDNVETNKDSIAGTIIAKIWSGCNLGVRNSLVNQNIKAKDVRDTKKFFQRPNIGISTGRVLGPGSGTFAEG
jgi:hypothetical protein